jgi:nitrogen regulatory protein PII
MRIKMSSMAASDSIASIRRLGKEVKRLSEQQAEAMQRARFGGMTVREVNGYGARHRRIIQLLKQLAMLEKKAYEQQKRKKLPTKIAEERKFTMTRKGVSR